jgi:arylsulfatase A
MNARPSAVALALLAAAASALALRGAGAAWAASSRLPNIVIVFTDDQGYADVGVFGAQGYETPNLDRLAAEGAVFRNFHVAQPVCSASRCGLLTGCYPNRLGIHGALGRRAERARDDARGAREAARLRHGHLRQVAPG